MVGGKRTGESIVKIILSLLMPFKARILIVLLCVIGSSAVTTVQPLLRQKLIDDGIVVGDLRQVIVISLIIFGLFAIGQVLSLVQFYGYTYVNKMLSFRLFYNAFRHLMKMPSSFFKDANSVQIIGNIEYDISNIGRITDSTFVISLVQGLTAIGSMVGLMIINWKLTLVVLCVIPVKILINGYFTKKRTKAFERSMEVYSAFSAWKGETIQGISTVKLWNMVRQKMRELIKLRRNVIHNEYQIAGTEQGNSFVSNTVDAVVNGGLYVLCAVLIFTGQLTLGGLFSFTAYAGTVIGAITFLTRIKFVFSPAFPSLKRYYEFMGEEEERGGRLGVSLTPACIEFKNVTLNYSDSVTALKNVSFEINAGEKVAIVGQNGSGKSSLMQLLLRLYEPSEGVITYCGTDIREIKIDEYRNLFSCVEQKPFLFNTSVRDNIDPMRCASDEEIAEAVKELGISEFIDGLPDGLETVAGVDGSKFSGGERQKIAALRAWLKPHKVLLLDEVSNNLDAESEGIFNDILSRGGGNEIIIVITHRQEILSKMDKVLFMNNGELITNESRG